MNGARLKPKCCNPAKGGCGNIFSPARPMQKACSPACARNFAEAINAKAAALRMREEKARTRVELEHLKTIPRLKAEAQHAFNRWIRHRDKTAGFGCICCGQPLDWDSTTPGGAVDAGHFMSRGSSPELAFDERNVNAQRKSCNRPGGAKRAAFVAGMTERWGAAVVAELQGPQKPVKWTREGLRAIRDDYRARMRQTKRTGA